MRKEAGSSGSLFSCMGIWVNGYRWEVVSTSDRRMLERDDGTVVLGVADRGRMCMFLWKGLSGSLLRMVLEHELCHAYMFSYGYVMPPEHEETLCRFFQSHARRIIREADELSAWMDKNIMKL